MQDFWTINSIFLVPGNSLWVKTWPPTFGENKRSRLESPAISICIGVHPPFPVRVTNRMITFVGNPKKSPWILPVWITGSRGRSKIYINISPWKNRGTRWFKPPWPFYPPKTFPKRSRELTIPKRSQNSQSCQVAVGSCTLYDPALLGSPHDGIPSSPRRCGLRCSRTFSKSLFVVHLDVPGI